MAGRTCAAVEEAPPAPALAHPLRHVALCARDAAAGVEACNRRKRQSVGGGGKACEMARDGRGRIAGHA